jgi:hypothetical protein
MLILDDQLPRGHDLIPPAAAPSGSQNHELEGEGLRPQPALEQEVPEGEMPEAPSKSTKTYEWETSPKRERTAPYGKDKGPKPKIKPKPTVPPQPEPVVTPQRQDEQDEEDSGLGEPPKTPPTCSCVAF